MICIAYSESDPVSRHAAEFVIKEYGFDEEEGRRLQDNVELLRVEGSLINAEAIDKKHFKAILFMSKHHSAAGINSFTAHSLGNWTAKAEFGGMPRALSKSSPLLMLACMSNLDSNAPTETNKVYEATHHGPLLDTPCTFIEFGGSEAAMEEHASAETLGRAAVESVRAIADETQELSHVVIGLGGNHYPLKFTKLALEKGYAFGHIMPSHSFIKDGNIWDTSMIEEAIARSDKETEFAVIDWKSFGSEQRKAVLNKLEELGIDYERV